MNKSSLEYPDVPHNHPKHFPAVVLKSVDAAKKLRNSDFSMFKKILEPVFAFTQKKHPEKNENNMASQEHSCSEYSSLPTEIHFHILTFLSIYEYVSIWYLFVANSFLL